ncbi:MAG: MoxR family ATPase [Lachnospiraceae bacterium]|nr:MoxR family ATPase [Lachnospiraceae bacterium]
MNKIYEALAEVNKVIKGKDETVLKVMAAILAGGHVLMEDIPGVGKTTLSTTFAKTLSMNYKRVQFTPDVLPSDIVGFSMYNSKTGEFDFKSGPIFCNFFLADEINRTSPKTQSALLEVMEEGSVTVDGITRKLDDVFVVIATQNPSGSAGTNMLPESQLDRFIIRLSMGYPGHEDTINILKNNISGKSFVEPKIDLNELKVMKQEAAQIFVHDAVYEYITCLCEATRTNEFFSMGVSPRGGISLLKMARSYAYIVGNDFVRPEDVQAVLPDVFCHRVKLSSKARTEGMNVYSAIDELKKSVLPPRQ